ncbi:MAG: hypothetical protein A2X51_14560 [Candidatus Rokubacteria bacterium GWC2_70_24]|nr:MAG: hypothetical protein A2X53_04685 [Candidatus Rokubacteria bacterium GWA2_70_23]OGK90787.1 MAG: hypothetical protein A2X51_14560 [Candidatus Rokubacteria bacterium GWC2_70_24]OGK91734.1 MAG: hypothetical protein A2X50_11230 [Candidatus Rokubacteria bacterium GWF2_70_14]HAM57635.1 hypothetical protein [Candidatus Rokubacteria bacterium]
MKSMKKVMGLTLAVLLGLGVGIAAAEEISGKIQKVDASERMFVLEDGTQLRLAEGLPTEGLKEGASVKASYEERDGQKVVTEIQISE